MVTATKLHENSRFSSERDEKSFFTGEEAVELVIEAMDNNDDIFLSEAADLMFRYLVLLAQKGYTLSNATSAHWMVTIGIFY